MPINRTSTKRGDIIRVALYARVSTDEQAKHGLSIEAQQAALRAWCEAQGHVCVGEYTDAGVSGKNVLRKRPALSRFIKDLEDGLQCDALVFTKLDRLYRSVKLYYALMDELDKYKVGWIAIQEDYETVTASGRFKVNIMLSVAENEADRTAERIKAVFQHKIDMGQAITRCQPFGYTVRDKRVVPDENAHIAKEMFEYFAATGNTYATRDMIQNKYGVFLNYESVYRFLQNPIYTGRYRDNPNYCEPLVSQELFDQVQADFAERRKTKRAPSGRVYLFSGLVVCAECGRKMTATHNPQSTRQPIRYRCPAHLMEKTCGNIHNVTEYHIEQELLHIVSLSVAGVETEYKISEKKSTVNDTAVRQKLLRLKELYIDGDISKEEYTAQRDKLALLLEQPKPKQPEPVKVFGADFLDHYAKFTQEQKRELWHSTIDHIVSDRHGDLVVCFLP